jgi:hypothetical protein
MEASDVRHLITRLKGLYKERFSAVSEPMIDVWIEELAPIPQDLMVATLRAWLRTNTFRAPTLSDLLALAVEVGNDLEEQQRRAAVAAKPVQSRDTPTILSDAARASGALWGKCHVQMFLAGVCAPGREEEAAQMCDAFAVDYPQDAHDWRIEAAWWRGGCHGKPSFATTRELGVDDE